MDSGSFSEGLSSFPEMPARGKRRRLLTAVIELYEQVGEVRGDRAPRRADRPPVPTFGVRLSDAQERVLPEVMEALTRIIEVVEARTSAPPPPANAVVAALGGAEIVMRSEMLLGRDDWLPRLLPSFTYLATIPFLDRDVALRFAARTERLARSTS